ncbi:hypothetical protein BX600DRAFT_442872 [Xylariales sp. PMI_506]|nr:hypothetical protein BX600DRAFT_442872 [Xylariales sp. PMI_506]
MLPRTAILLAALTHLSRATDLPRYFGSTCDDSGNGTSEIAYAPPLDSGYDFTIDACFLVGTTCTFSKDCPMPKKDQCQVQTEGAILQLDQADCINGVCRVRRSDVNDVCDCLHGCKLKSDNENRDLSCIQGKCVAAECAPCGDLPLNRACCGAGVIDHDGKCYCPTGVGEGCAVNPKQCYSGDYNDMCCGKGTDNEGRCCMEGTCNGICRHDPNNN